MCYFRRFVPGFATIGRPLSDILRRDKIFEFDKVQIMAFQQLKMALTQAPVLQLYNPRAETEVHTDASKDGYGGILLHKVRGDQRFHPVQYMSRKTKPEEEKYHSYELEAVKKWRVYLLGIKFKIVTDCNAFAMTMRKRDIPLRVSRWAMLLQDFDYVIEHRSGNNMRHVDALSRVTWLLLEDTLHHRLQQEQLKDEWIHAIMKARERGAYQDYFIKDGILYKDPVKEQVVVPESMQDEVIKIAHEEGHYSIKRTQDAVEKQFYIPKLQRKAEKVVRSCIRCIMMEAKAGRREGFLLPIDKQSQPLDTCRSCRSCRAHGANSEVVQPYTSNS